MSICGALAAERHISWPCPFLPWDSIHPAMVLPMAKTNGTAQLLMAVYLSVDPHTNVLAFQH